MTKKSESLVVRHTELPSRVKSDQVIIRLQQAEKALQFATTIHQAKLVADFAAAQEIFAHRQRLGKVIEDQAFQLKIYALAKLGELLKMLDKNVGAKGSKVTGSVQEPVRDRTPTLAELGLDKKTSMVAQQLAALPSPIREAIAQRETTVAKVRREDKAVEIRRVISLPDAKYRVLYADPPWSYGDKADEGAVQSGGAARHYPSMSIAELCALPIQTICEEHAVLFLWVTSPLLSECFAVITAWGFTYKASFVWDKIKHNMGHYNSVRHEFLLICTRGSCVPDVPALIDSVQSIERTTHSTKPEEFRRIIEQLYPHGKKLELFARKQTANWDTYGNEDQS